MPRKSKTAMVRNLFKLREAAKEAQYALDNQLEEICRHMEIGETVEIDDEEYVLASAFEKSNTAFRCARIHGLDIVPLAE